MIDVSQVMQLTIDNTKQNNKFFSTPGGIAGASLKKLTFYIPLAQFATR